MQQQVKSIEIKKKKIKFANLQISNILHDQCKRGLLPSFHMQVWLVVFLQHG